MRLIRVMCSGRVDLEFVLRAFANGMDGVFIGGCHLGDCNYITHGNYQALNMVLLAKRIMAHIGLDPERLKIAFMSGSEANLFVDGVNSHVKKVKDLGPLAHGLDKDKLKADLARVTKLVPYLKVALKEKLASRMEDPGSYDALFTQAEIDTLLTEVISYYIDPEKCQACMTCARRCPADAIISAKGQVHIIDQEKCIKCGTCMAVCPPRFGSISTISGEVPAPPPEGMRTVKRKGKEREEERTGAATVQE